MSSVLSGFGPFHLLEILGEGLRSTVYRARKEGDDQEFALKVLHVTVADDDFERRAFEERSKAATNIQGQGVVRITSTGTIDDRPYITMPLLDGLSLDRMPRRGDRFKLNPKQASHLLHAILTGLRQGLEASPPLIHGRLNEGSVVIGCDGNVSLLGFGTPGAAQTDLRPLAKLAQRFTNRWPAELDSYLDALQAPEGFKNVAEALEAFPLTEDDRDATSLGRAVKRRIKALKSETEAPAEDPTSTVPAEISERVSLSPPPSPREQPIQEASEDAVSGPNQAKWIALLCGSLVLVAFVLEIWDVPL